MITPEDLRYTEEHEWLKIEDEAVILGITDFAQNSLGDVVFVDLPEIGTTAEAGDSIGSIESVKTVAELFCPVAGEVIEINEELEDRPELVNSAPYENGWMVKIKVDSSVLTSDKFMDSDAYADFIK